MIKFLVHDAGGVILRTGLCTYTDLYLQDPNPMNVLAYEEDISDLTHYIGPQGDILIKTPFSLTPSGPTIEADGIDIFSVSGIPPGTMVTWPDMDVILTADHTVEWTEDLIGTFKFIFRHTEHLDEEVSFEAI